MKINKWANEINKLEAGDSFTTKKWCIEAKKDFNGCDGCSFENDLAGEWCSEVSCVSKGIIYKKTRRNNNENSK